MLKTRHFLMPGFLGGKLYNISKIYIKNLYSISFIFIYELLLSYQSLDLSDP